MKKMITMLCLLSIMFVGCSKGIGSTGEGVCPDIKLDDVSVTLGKTKLGDLYNKGFARSSVYYQNPEEQYSIDANEYTVRDIHIEKDGKEYGGVKIVNTSNKEAEIKNCIIHTVTYNYYYTHHITEENDENRRGTITVNGNDFTGYTLDEIKDTMKDYKLFKEEEDYLWYTDGDYYYQFNIGEQGTLEKISLEIKLDVEFN